ncbi:decaprenyl-phosphate phosphoribosyltransferase [Baaleninema simplex]|uniref:decaprenyl-phosphate phosphoribosyltransferase n=1 Tax=Baaleninema simplex TaxID=2862350 RepID=UPI00034A251C|nr:decaprenyl-phosphate phosphoribosyltransferase [Baaleninema simplex]
MTLSPHVRALRPRQWTKNAIVFAAPLFAFDLTPATLLGSSLAFVLFCAISSSFYLVNDIVDVNADRLHPIKRHRPIASGQVKMSTAKVMAAVLLVGGLGLGWWKAWELGAVLTLYTVLQAAYNLGLKRLVILDVMAIATGFVLRAVAGAAAIDIRLSPWFLLCTAFLALFLGIEKRKAELRLSQLGIGKTRPVLKRYSFLLLGRMENIVTTGTIMTYAIWSSGPQVEGAPTPWMMLTLPFVLYGLFRYQLLSDPKIMERPGFKPIPTSDRSERPEEILLSDWPVLLTIVGWILTVCTILGLYERGVIS